MPCTTNMKESCNMGLTCILDFFLNPKYMSLSHSKSLFYSLYPPSLTCLSGLCANAWPERHLQLSSLGGPKYVAFL